MTLCVEQDPFGNIWAGTVHGVSKIHGVVPMLSQSSPEKFADLKLYPNPANNRIWLQSSEMILETEVFNMTGQRLKFDKCSNFQHTLDISALPAGHYLIRVTGSRQVQVKQFVIIR
jgi:hypothetical protein